MEFLIKDGALDEDLSKEGSVFPVVDGKPTFKPSAAWYIDQADSRNALTLRMYDKKVMRRKDDNDLHCAMRVEGTFTEVYELADYPFDVQGLTVTLNFNTRCNGPVPCEVKVDPECNCTMTCITLCPPNKEWTVAPELHVRAHNVGTGDRLMPAVSFTAKVTREPFYHLVFFAVPMGLFSLLSILNGTVHRPQDLNHRAQLALMLVLTVSTYRIAISQRLPPINYLTLLDHYTVPTALITILVAIEARVVTFYVDPALANDPPPEQQLASRISFYTSCVLAGCWLVLHVHFTTIACMRSFHPRVHDENLQDPMNSLLDEAIVPKLRVDSTAWLYSAMTQKLMV